MNYTKLFASIITSTIWTEDDTTRIVWITMLASASKDGEVMASVPGLARIAGVSMQACEAALNKFLSPDPHSRTKDDEGRRIEVIDGGWQLLNHKKYREMASKEESREAEANRKARYRAKLARNGKSGMSHNVPDMSHEVPKNRHIAEEDTEEKAAAAAIDLFSDPESPSSENDFVQSWNALPEPFAKIQEMTEDMGTKLKARMADRFWRENWRTAVKQIPQSPFMRGEGENGWVASADWFLKPDSVDKSIEGKYRNGAGRSKARPKPLPSAADARKGR